MTARDGYALDLLSPVRHVATEMERAGSSGPAPTIEAMTATYDHTITGDLARIRQHEGADSDYEARVWLIRKAVQELGDRVARDENGGYRLTKPLEQIRYKHQSIRQTVRAGEESEKEVLAAVYHNLDKELRPFHVTVASPRGNTRQAELTLHPLAHEIPRMSAKEFADLAADVKANGVRVPITVMGGKVIDGRHRLAVASALNVPVRTEEFTGSEDEARRHIVSLNLIRRNLTIAQRTLIVRRVLLPEAEAEAKERHRANAGDRRSASADLREPIEGKKASQVAAERSAGLASARSIEIMAPVDDAPETQERIRSGEIKSATEARREALKETGRLDEPTDLPALKPRSAYQRLGCAAGDIRAATDAIKSDDRGNIPLEEFADRLNEISQMLRDLQKLLAAQWR